MRYIIVSLLLVINIACKTKNNDPSPVFKEPEQVYISSVVSSPTSSESITLKNNSGITTDISGWTLGDTNDPTAYSIPSNTILAQGQFITFLHTTLGFQINDSNEILYLKNGGVNWDIWRN